MPSTQAPEKSNRASAKRNYGNVHDLLTTIGHVPRASVNKASRSKDRNRLEELMRGAEFNFMSINVDRFGLEFNTTIVTKDNVAIKSKVEAWIVGDRVEHLGVTDRTTGTSIASAETEYDPDKRRSLAAGEPGTNLLIIKERLKVHRDRGTTTLDPISKGAERDVIGALGDIRQQFEILRHALFDLQLLWKSFIHVKEGRNLQANELPTASFPEQVAYLMKHKRQAMISIKAMLDDMVKTNRYRYELTVVGGTGVKAWSPYG